MDNIPRIPVPVYWLEEKIERAMKATKDVNEIEHLFLVVPVGSGSEGETQIETKYGKLKVFFCSELMEYYKYELVRPKLLLLNDRKFKYPKVSRVRALRHSIINPHLSS